MNEAKAVVLAKPPDLVLELRVENVDLDADDLVAHRRHGVVDGACGPALGGESTRNTGRTATKLKGKPGLRSVSVGHTKNWWHCPGINVG